MKNLWGLEIEPRFDPESNQPSVKITLGFADVVMSLPPQHALDLAEEIREVAEKALRMAEGGNDAT